MLKLLTNHSRLVLDMQIILPRWELQVHVAKDNGILRDDSFLGKRCLTLVNATVKANPGLNLVYFILYTKLFSLRLRLLTLKSKAKQYKLTDLTVKLQNSNPNSVLSWVSLIGPLTTRSSALKLG